MLTEEALNALLAKAGERSFEIVADAESAAPLAVVQEGYDVRSLEEFLPAPSRIRQVVNLTSPAAFVAYTKRFGGPDAVVFVGEQSFVSKLDYHGEMGSPSWCTHTANYAPKQSHQWQAWLGSNKQAKNQLEFALFLESRLNDIVSPAPATVLTAVLNFREAADCTVASSQRLETGEVNFQFVKENRVQATRFPHELTLCLPIFDHHPAIEIGVYVRYRVQNDGVLRIWYQFKQDPIDIVRQHFESVSAQIGEQLAGLPFFEGVPA